MDELGNSSMVIGIKAVECSADDGPLYCLVWIMLPKKLSCQVIEIGLLGGCIMKLSLQMLCDTLIVNE